MIRKQAYLYLYASHSVKIHQIHGSDIFRLKIRIPDKNNLFATLDTEKNFLCLAFHIDYAVYHPTITCHCLPVNLSVTSYSAKSVKVEPFFAFQTDSPDWRDFI